MSNTLSAQKTITLIGESKPLKIDNYIDLTVKTHDVYPANAGILESVIDFDEDDYNRVTQFLLGVAPTFPNNLGMLGPIDSAEPRSDDPVNRAAAIFGHLGLPAEHAIYFPNFVNCDGEVLTCDRTEVVTSRFRPFRSDDRRSIVYFCEEDGMIPKKRTLCLCVCAALISLVAWAEEPEKKLSEDIAYATYGESADRVKVVVSSVVAKIEKPEQYLPLQIAVGLRGAGPEISFSYQSFQLIDGHGNYAATATPQDLQNDLKFWMETQNVRKRRPIQTGGYFQGYNMVVSQMYPKVGLGSGTNLAQNMAFQDVIFFPLPKQLDGVMTLVVMGKGMDDPVNVRFELPIKHKKPDAEKKD